MSEKKVILITGASRGIGRHLVEHYVRQSYNVIGCSRGESASSENYTHYTTDVSSERDVVKMLNSIREKFGRLDVLINNAAINPTLSLTLMTSFKDASDTLSTNVLGTFIVSREAAKLMMRHKSGRIICLSSMAVRHEVSGEAIYSASKAAVHSMARVMAKELYPLGITCNVIAPSALPTELMESVPKDALMEVLRRNAIPQLGEFSDVTNATDFLIQPGSQAITGQVLYLGGA